MSLAFLATAVVALRALWIITKKRGAAVAIAAHAHADGFLHHCYCGWR
jgi:hypothetical protein